MSTDIQFHKVYTRVSRSPWDDLARVVMTWQPETKQGIYMHVGVDGVNGFAFSRDFQSRLPAAIRGHYVSSAYADVIFHIFQKDIEEYCQAHVEQYVFKKQLVANQDVFFSETAKVQWQMSYDKFLEQNPQPH